MTPAETLRAAAKKIRALAETAQHDLETADYWKPYASDAWAHGLINGFGGPSSDYAAVLPPQAGIALAKLLEAVLSSNREASPAHEECDPWCSPETCDLSAALAAARAILGTPDGQP